MSKKNIRVVIPKNPEEAIAVGLKAVAKHEKDGDSSLLRGLDMGAFKEILTVASAENARSKDFHKKGHACTQVRDNAVGTHVPIHVAVGTVRHVLAAIRDILRGNLKGRERMLAEWGFDVIIGGRHAAEEPPPGGAPEDPKRRAA